MNNYIVHIEGQTDITIRAYTASDAEYEALESLSDNGMELEVTHTELVDSDDSVCFIFNDRKITINKDYSLSDWPEGFCSVFDDILVKLIDR